MLWPYHLATDGGGGGCPCGESDPPIETDKVWREQVHRFLAGMLGVEVLVLSLLAARRRRFGVAQICSAVVLVVLSIPLYMAGQRAGAMAAAVLGEVILLFAAFCWNNQDLSRAAVLTLAVVIFQALLGMWTVTLLLKPIVVIGHLLGGLLMFALLVWMAWRATHLPITLGDATKLRCWLRLGLVVLVLQIALGGGSVLTTRRWRGGGAWLVDNFPRCVVSGGRRRTSVRASLCCV